MTVTALSVRGTSGTYAGLTFGPVPGQGVMANPVLCTHIDGLDDEPPARLNDTARDQDDGSWVSPFWLGDRVLTLDFTLLSNGDPVAFRSLLQAFKAAFQKTDTVQPLLIDDGTRVVFGRVTNRHIARDRNYYAGAAQAVVEFTCADPRVYDATLQQQTVMLPVPPGGSSWPWVWPVSWGGATTSGQITAVNAGDYPMRPTIVIAGPVDNPTVENVTAGKHLSLAISLSAIDTLTIDLDARSIVLDGTGPRRNALTSDSSWWQLAPGTNIVNYRANTVAVGSTMTMSWRSAWI